MYCNAGAAIRMSWPIIEESCDLNMRKHVYM